MYALHYGLFLISFKVHSQTITLNNDVYCFDTECVCIYIYGVYVQVVVDTAQIENKEAYAPQITLEGSRVVVQVPSTWWVQLVIIMENV